MRLVVLLCAACSAQPSIGYAPGSPWPKFRGDAAQDGAGARATAGG